MCIVKVHPEPEPTTVPNRPVLRVQASPPQTHRSSLTIERRPASRSRVPAPASPRRSQPEHQQQAIVISQVTPRSSRTGIPLRPLSQTSYSYGDGPVPTAAMGNGNLLGAGDAGLESRHRRRSSSMTYAKSPRQSGASFRTTRERIVVVDEGGRRREYYRRDDSEAGKKLGM